MFQQFEKCCVVNNFYICLMIWGVTIFVLRNVHIIRKQNWNLPKHSKDIRKKYFDQTFTNFMFIVQVRVYSFYFFSKILWPTYFRARNSTFNVVFLTILYTVEPVFRMLPSSDEKYQQTLISLLVSSDHKVAFRQNTNHHN